MTPAEYHAVQVPPVLMPMLRQWMRTHCGRQYEEPRPFRVGPENTLIWVDDERRKYEQIALRREFAEHRQQRAIKPYAALTDAELQQAAEIIDRSAVATTEQIQRITTPTRFPSIQSFRQTRCRVPGSEKDFGATHRENDSPAPDEPGDAWTVAVVNETGDVYAECRRTGEVILLGQVSANDGYTDAEQRFHGWEQSTNGRNLSWFAERCQQPS